MEGAPGGGRLRGSILFLGLRWKVGRGYGSMKGLLCCSVALAEAGSLDESCGVVWNLNLGIDTNR